MYISIIVYVYMHMCTHIYMYICMYLSLYTHRCVHTYIPTYIKYWCVLLNIQWLEWVRNWNADLKSPSQLKWQKTWKNPEAVKESLKTCYIQKTPTVYSAYSLFFKERKWQQKNSRDLAKFQNLLERRRLVGREKSVEITGSLFRKCLCFVFLVMWQEKNFS